MGYTCLYTCDVLIIRVGDPVISKDSVFGYLDPDRADYRLRLSVTGWNAAAPGAVWRPVRP